MPLNSWCKQQFLWLPFLAKVVLLGKKIPVFGKQEKLQGPLRSLYYSTHTKWTRNQCCCPKTCWVTQCLGVRLTGPDFRSLLHTPMLAQHANWVFNYPIHTRHLSCSRIVSETRFEMSIRSEKWKNMGRNYSRLFLGKVQHVSGLPSKLQQDPQLCCTSYLWVCPENITLLNTCYILTVRPHVSGCSQRAQKMQQSHTAPLNRQEWSVWGSSPTRTQHRCAHTTSPIPHSPAPSPPHGDVSAFAKG